MFGAASAKTVYRLLYIAHQKHLRAERFQLVRDTCLQRIDVLKLVYKHVLDLLTQCGSACCVGQYAARAVFEIRIIELAERGFFIGVLVDRGARKRAQRFGIRRAVDERRRSSDVALLDESFTIGLDLLVFFVKRYKRDVRLCAHRSFRHCVRRLSARDHFVQHAACRNEFLGFKLSRPFRKPLQFFGKRGMFFGKHAFQLRKVIRIGHATRQISVGVGSGQRIIDYVLDRFYKRIVGFFHAQCVVHHAQRRVARTERFRHSRTHCGALVYFRLAVFAHDRRRIDARRIKIRFYQTLTKSVQRAYIGHGQSLERGLRRRRMRFAQVLEFFDEFYLDVRSRRTRERDDEHIFQAFAGFELFGYALDHDGGFAAARACRNYRIADAVYGGLLFFRKFDFAHRRYLDRLSEHSAPYGQ